MLKSRISLLVLLVAVAILQIQVSGQEIPPAAAPILDVDIYAMIYNGHINTTDHYVEVDPEQGYIGAEWFGTKKQFAMTAVAEDRAALAEITAYITYGTFINAAGDYYTTGGYLVQFNFQPDIDIDEWVDIWFLILPKPGSMLESLDWQWLYDEFVPFVIDPDTDPSDEDFITTPGQRAPGAGGFNPCQIDNPDPDPYETCLCQCGAKHGICNNVCKRNQTSDTAQCLDDVKASLLACAIACAGIHWIPMGPAEPGLKPLKYYAVRVCLAALLPTCGLTKLILCMTQAHLKYQNCRDLSLLEYYNCVDGCNAQPPISDFSCPADN